MPCPTLPLIYIPNLFVFLMCIGDLGIILHYAIVGSIRVVISDHIHGVWSKSGLLVNVVQDMQCISVSDLGCVLDGAIAI